VYDVAEDGKTTTQLRAHVRRLAKDLDDLKSIVSLLAMAPDRAQAATWANEVEKNGFAHHSAEEIKKSLQVRPLQNSDNMLLTYPGPNGTATRSTRPGLFRYAR